ISTTPPWEGESVLQESTPGKTETVDDIVIVDMPWININAIKVQLHTPQPVVKPAGNGHDQSHDDGRKRTYPHGEQRKGRCVASYLYKNHLGEPHTKIEKRRSPGAKRAQYPQSFWVGGRWVSEKPKGWVKVPYRLPELLEAVAKNPGTDVFLPEGE